MKHNPPSQFWDTTSYENGAVASSVGRASSRLRGNEATPAAQARAGSSVASPHPNSGYSQGNQKVGTRSTASEEAAFSRRCFADDVEVVPTLWSMGSRRELFRGIGAKTEIRFHYDCPAHVLLAALAALAVLSGCERSSSTDRPQTPAAGSSRTESVSNKTATVSNPATPDSKSELVRIPGGRFVMGDKNEVDAPPHEVGVSAFAIDKFLVTQEQFQKVMGTNPSRWKGDKNPVEQVRWSDAVKFCNKRSQLEGLEPCYDLDTWKCNFDANGYRLPTEAEWEYACRAGTTTPYFFGDSPAKLGEYSWFEKNSGGRPRPVGQKQPNPWGLYDLCGNVWEWCNDFYKVDYYKDAPPQDPKGPDTGETKVLRGGAWRSRTDDCRSGYRYNENPGYADVCFGYDIYGFRCVRKTGGSGGR